MIAKDPDPVHADSRRVQAGARAERDMAFYLRRAFGDHRRDVVVFNDIRIEHEGEVGQMDHLVLHIHGMFIIESKSVSGEIQILPDGQFIRVYGGKRTGMPSPVLQARRQGDLLRRLLQANKERLRDRKLFGMVQGGFTHCPIEIRVAISDQGIIRGDKHAPEVRRADLIPDDIEERLSAHRRGGHFLNLDPKSEDGLYRFTDSELARLGEFLLTRHVPRETPSPARGMRPTQSPPPPPPPVPGPITPPLPSPVATAAAPTPDPSRTRPRIHYLCSKCQSLDLRILHGKYGYYFKCRACSGNTWIDTTIADSDRKGRIRKAGRDFFLICPDTGRERLLFTNPDDEE
jgi:hypothetical protein